MDTRVRNVCTEIVVHNLCIGCGLCAGVCPNRTLEVSFNDYGEYVPCHGKDSCAPGCDLCLKVCPYYNNPDDEDTLSEKLFANTLGISYRPETGYYLKNFVAYSNLDDHRANGASGGMATWILETLLKENFVQQVACVGIANGREKLFKFTVCDQPEQVRQCSGTKYYPVEASQIVRHILSNEGRYALIGLPCLVKAMRLAMQVLPKLRKRVKFLMGLTCGQGKSKFFVERACAIGGGDPHHLDEFKFRIKDPQHAPNDYRHRFVSNAGTEMQSCGIVRNLGFGDRYFTPNACNFCTDTFAELADATFMDAWLHDYVGDWRGHTIVLVRDKIICQLVEAGHYSGELVMQDLSIDRVIESQRQLVYSKRNLTPERCRLAVQAGCRVPRIRSPLENKLPYGKRLLAHATWLASIRSRKEWSRFDKDLKKFQRAMVPYAAALIGAKLVDRLLQRPWNLLSVLWRHFLRGRASG